MNIQPVDFSVNVVIGAAFVILLNIPFGMWRASVRTFTYQWFLAVHIPVPVIIALRIYGELGFALYTYVVLVGAFFAGQRIGAFLYSRTTSKE